MKNILLTLTILYLFSFESIAQLNKKQLAIEEQITVKEILDLRLQVLSAQISSGSYIILDLPRLTFPVSINIDDDLRIRFEINGNLPSDISKETKNGLVKGGMIFVQTAISELLRRNFPKIDFDRKKDILGFWYFGEGYVPLAKWENDNITWLREP
jgi:hypothetical protein